MTKHAGFGLATPVRDPIGESWKAPSAMDLVLGRKDQLVAGVFESPRGLIVHGSPCWIISRATDKVANDASMVINKRHAGSGRLKKPTE